MPRVVLAVVILAIYVYGLVDVIRTDKHLTRGFSKTTWIIMVALLPLIGAALWFLIGRPRASATPRPVYPQHPTAPDDDPDFLRNLEQRRREAERLRKLRNDAAGKNQADAGPHRTGATGSAPGAGAGTTSSGNSGTGNPPAGEPGPRKPGAAGEANAEGNPEAK